MSRKEGISGPVARHTGWTDLQRARVAFDEFTIGWADKLDANWLKGDLAWFSGRAGHELTRPRRLHLMHFFDHHAPGAICA
jgi:uncharacterized damage-inducible protein DinB